MQTVGTTWDDPDTFVDLFWGDCEHCGGYKLFREPDTLGAMCLDCEEKSQKSMFTRVMGELETKRKGGGS